MTLEDRIADEMVQDREAALEAAFDDINQMRGLTMLSWLSLKPIELRLKLLGTAFLNYLVARRG
ncbi:MAG: hypothetical protein U5K28_05360 [Halobacteriales archaeon]|nr:hypothetical protein [Halobacteriales archaeon]